MNYMNDTLSFLNNHLGATDNKEMQTRFALKMHTFLM